MALLPPGPKLAANFFIDARLRFDEALQVEPVVHEGIRYAASRGYAALTCLRVVRAARDRLDCRSQTGFSLAAAMATSRVWMGRERKFRTGAPREATQGLQYVMKLGGPTLQIPNERVVQLAAKLAAIRHSTKTDAVRQALENERARIEREKTLAQRIRPIQDRFASRPATGLEADKAFFDELSGEP